MTVEQRTERFRTLSVTLALGLVITSVLAGVLLYSMHVVVENGYLGNLEGAADAWCKSHFTEYPYHNGQLTTFEGKLAIKCSYKDAPGTFMISLLEMEKAN